MESILTEYGPMIGYIVVLFGSFVEGETVVLTAGFLAYKGYLSLPVIMVIAFAGSLLADQLLFYIGRFYGPNLIERKPKIKEKSERVFRLLHKYNIGFILSFRFIYGIRVASPLIIGASGISIKRFTILNFIAAVIWSVISCTAGYLLGYFFADDVEYILEKIVKYQKTAAIIAAIVIAAAAVIFYCVRRWKNKKNIEIKD